MEAWFQKASDIPDFEDYLKPDQSAVVTRFLSKMVSKFQQTGIRI